MQIRLAQKHDYDQLLNLLRQLNPNDPEISNVEYKVFEEILCSIYFDLVVAESEGSLLGTCYLNIVPNITAGGRPYAVIENVVTDERNRKQGIGKSLVDWAVSKAWEQGCYKVMLMSGRADSAVHEFYLRCGFDPNEKQAYIRRAP